jgi:hypothetical protein
LHRQSLAVSALGPVYTAPGETAPMLNAARELFTSLPPTIKKRNKAHADLSRRSRGRKKSGKDSG